jgi:glycosyltransferase involved in cell wall biosynthesis
MVKVSVIVPVYNVERYLRRSIESILNQTFQQFELILVNDGSTDSSPQICESYAANDPRVKVLHQKNAGFGEARNTGLKQATGEYVYFMDSDDWADEDLLRCNYAIANETKADSVIFGHRKVYSSSRVENIIDMTPPGSGLADIIPLLDGGFGFAVWEQLMRRDLLVQNNLAFPPYKREADIAFLLDFYRFCNSIVVNPTSYYTYNCFYSATKFNGNSKENHKHLYRRLIKLVSAKKTKIGDRLKAKFLALWFCHVVPINYVAAPITLKEKFQGLRALMNDAEIIQWIKEVESKKKGTLLELSLRVFGFRSVLLMWVFTKGKLVVKRNIKVNFKKIFYK